MSVTSPATFVCLGPDFRAAQKKPIPPLHLELRNLHTDFEIQQVVALADKVREALERDGHGTYTTLRSADWYENTLRRGNKILGLYDGSNLVGKGLVILNPESYEEEGIFPDGSFALPPLRQTAALSGIALLPAYEGRGLGKFITACRCAIAKGAGKKFAVVIFVEGNSRNQKSLASCGLQQLTKAPVANRNQGTIVHVACADLYKTLAPEDVELRDKVWFLPSLFLAPTYDCGL